MGATPRAPRVAGSSGALVSVPYLVVLCGRVINQAFIAGACLRPLHDGCRTSRLYGNGRLLERAGAACNAQDLPSRGSGGGCARARARVRTARDVDLLSRSSGAAGWHAVHPARGAYSAPSIIARCPCTALQQIHANGETHVNAKCDLEEKEEKQERVQSEEGRAPGPKLGAAFEEREKVLPSLLHPGDVPMAPRPRWRDEPMQCMRFVFLEDCSARARDYVPGGTVLTPGGRSR